MCTMHDHGQYPDRFEESKSHDIALGKSDRVQYGTFDGLSEGLDDAFDALPLDGPTSEGTRGNRERNIHIALVCLLTFLLIFRCTSANEPSYKPPNRHVGIAGNSDALRSLPSLCVTPPPRGHTISNTDAVHRAPLDHTKSLD